MRSPGKRDLIKICYLYYREGKTQGEISSHFGLSRFQVSRLLKKAREDGLVTVQINDPMGEVTEIEIELAKTFGLTQAIVEQTNEYVTRNPLEHLGEAGAQYLSSVIKDCRILGVAWGRSVYQIINSVAPMKTKGLIVVQISGGLGSIGGTDSSVLTGLLGQRLGAAVHVLHAPAIVSDPSIKKTLLNEKNIHEGLALARKADTALLGIGMVSENGLLQVEGLLDRETTRLIEGRKAVGAVCGRFFDINGKKCYEEMDERIIGLDFDDLRRIKNKICIAMGPKKVLGIIGAMRGKLINTLITDESTARSILEYSS